MIREPKNPTPARLAPPEPGDVVRGTDGPPVLLVVIDTEEEFDWSAGFDRSNTDVRHLRSIEPLQAVFDEFGLRATWVIDYPVASQKDGYEPLRALREAGKAEIGAHLHPWVSPPHDEEVTPFHSYPGNLPRELERAKLEELAATIADNLGERPRVYKAGRYGFGPNTARTLYELGFLVDLSPAPPFVFDGDGGPDWSAFPADPYRFGPGNELLAIPNTGGYVGFVRGGAHRLYSLATRTALSKARLAGILSRVGAVERLMLSPEGYEPEHNRRLTRALLARGTRVFTFSLHSPSVKPGCTPYVRSEADLVQFLDACRRYFEFFLGELGGVGMTALELRDHLSAGARKAVS
jgi:hypothetical protein